MERRGFISRTRNSQDRRKVNIPTHADEGRRLREVLLPYAMEVNQVALAGIAPKKIPLLREQLDRIKRNLDADTIQDAGSQRPEAAPPAGRSPIARSPIQGLETGYEGKIPMSTTQTNGHKSDKAGHGSDAAASRGLRLPRPRADAEVLRGSAGLADGGGMA